MDAAPVLHTRYPLKLQKVSRYKTDCEFLINAKRSEEIKFYLCTFHRHRLKAYIKLDPSAIVAFE